MQHTLNSEEIVAQIRMGGNTRERAIGVLYSDTKLRNGIRKIVRRKDNPEVHFQDIFNLSLVQFIKNVVKDDQFKVKENIHSYLFGIARNLHLMQLRKEKNKHTQQIESVFDVPIVDVPIDVQIVDRERQKLLNDVLSKVGDKCRVVLTMWASGFKMREIAEKIGYDNESSVRKKKFDCMKKLSQYMDGNPAIANMLKI